MYASDANWRRLANINDAEAMGRGSRLLAVNVCKGVATAVVTVYDGTDTTGTVIATIDAATARSVWFGGIRCANGLYVKLTTAAADVTVSYC